MVAPLHALVFQHEGHFERDAISDDLAVVALYFHVLHPSALNVLKGLLRPLDPFCTASSKPFFELAMISVTLATDMTFSFRHLWP